MKRPRNRCLRSGDHSWNSGMFVWRADAILAEIKQQMPGLSSTVVTRSRRPGIHPEQDETLHALWPGI